MLSMWRAVLPLLEDLQGEVEQLSLALLPPLDHLQDGDGSAQVSPQLQHLLVRRLVVLTVLRRTSTTFSTHLLYTLLYSIALHKAYVHNILRYFIDHNIP